MNNLKKVKSKNLAHQVGSYVASSLYSGVSELMGKIWTFEPR